MNKKKQQELINETIKSKQKTQDCLSFKKLQKYWYDKLKSKTGFKDIEISKVHKHRFYRDEFSFLYRSTFSIGCLTNFDGERFLATQQHFQTLRKISWNAIATSNSSVFNPSKPFKTHKLTKIDTNSHSNSSPHDNNEAQKLNSDSNNSPSHIIELKTQKLSKVHSKILYLHAQGYTIENISNYLRRYFKHHSTRKPKGTKNRPFSVYYVHTALKKILQDVEAGHILEAPKAGEVKKRVSKLNSYIYTENNNREGGGEKP